MEKFASFFRNIKKIGNMPYMGSAIINNNNLNNSNMGKKKKEMIIISGRNEEDKYDLAHALIKAQEYAGDEIEMYDRETPANTTSTKPVAVISHCNDLAVIEKEATTHKNSNRETTIILSTHDKLSIQSWMICNQAKAPEIKYLQLEKISAL
jgi:hypothetical protein